MCWPTEVRLCIEWEFHFQFQFDMKQKKKIPKNLCSGFNLFYNYGSLHYRESNFKSKLIKDEQE